MQVLNNLSPIPFYDDLYAQDRYKWYSYGEQYKHYVPNSVLLPFYIILPHDANIHYNLNTLSVSFYRLSDCGDKRVLGAGSYNNSFNGSFDIITSNEKYETRLRSNGFYLSPSTDYDVLIYYANEGNNPNAIPIGLPKGMYYMDLTIRGQASAHLLAHLVSEVFTVEDSALLNTDKVRLEWWCQDNIGYNGGVVPYGITSTPTPGITHHYKSVVYLDTEIAMPEYEFTEEGEERNGYFYPTKQISDKVYKMRFVAPEYLCDAMRLVRMADYANVQFNIRPNVGRRYDIGQFEMEVDWLEQGYYADVSCSFKTDTLVKKIGKAY